MTHHLLRATLMAGLFTFAGAHAATMDKAEYKAAKERIEADSKMDKAACDKMTGNAKDVCKEEGKAKEKVAMAELKYRDTGKASDMHKVAEVKAETTYAVAKEKCDDKTGNDKDVCVKEAKAAETKAKADAKAASKSGEARKDAMQDKRDADYKVAAEKCDAMTGDAKSSCIAAAKAQHGKS
jgi:hypothetical protein